MKKLNPIEYLTGFLMGFFFGFFLDSVLFFLFKKINTESGEAPFPWWLIFVLVLLPVLCGMIMGRAIASLHLEDY